MKELDIVKLVDNHKQIKKGTIGTILVIYDNKNCEVEFFDEIGNTIDVVMTPIKKLEFIEYIK